MGVSVVAGLYLLSLLGKEQGVFLPLLLPVLRRFAGVSPTDRSFRVQRADVALLASLGIYAFLRIAALGSQVVPSGDASVGYGYPWWARVNLTIVTMGTYLRLMVVPWGQTTYYGGHRV